MTATWTKPKFFPIEALIQVGFAPQSDYLLVVSHQGRGVFDCLSGQKIARDNNGEWWQYFDEATLLAEGIGLLESQKILTAGLFGGSLSKTTADNGTLLEESESTRVFLKHEFSPNEDAMFVGDGEVCEMRAFGFSDTGNSFIIATTSDVAIYARAMLNKSLHRSAEQRLS